MEKNGQDVYEATANNMNRGVGFDIITPSDVALVMSMGEDEYTPVGESGHFGLIMRCEYYAGSVESRIQLWLLIGDDGEGSHYAKLYESDIGTDTLWFTRHTLNLTDPQAIRALDEERMLQTRLKGVDNKDVLDI